MGRMVNKEQTQSSKPNEGFRLLHRPELLTAAAHGDYHEIERLLLLTLHREEPDEVVLDVEETIADINDTVVVDNITGAGDTVLHVVASSGDADEFLECAAVIVREASHLLHAWNRKGDTLLHCAARLGNARMVSHLLTLASAGDGSSDDGRVKAILRMQNRKEETVLHEAVRLEDKDLICELLIADSQLARVPLTDAASPLYLALSLGRRDIAQLLFDKDKELSYSGPDGQNALHAAVRWKGSQEMIEMLMEKNKHLIKQADRSTGWTPLHMAALFGETRVTELLLEADPSPAYLPDNNGSFPIHLAASNDQPGNVLALLQKRKSTPGNSSSRKQKSGPYSAQLRDGEGRTFLHVAVEKKNVTIEKKSMDVVRHACQWQGKWFASSVLNMQDDQGNTALHLAVKVGNMRAFNDLLSVPEVKLNLRNNKGQTPGELAFSMVPKGPYFRYSTTDSVMYWLLDDAAHLTASPLSRQNILPARLNSSPRSQDREIQEKESESIIARTQIIGLGSVLIATVTFAAAFAVPGGYKADGTPTLAGHYAFDAFVMANTLAFIFSCLSVVFLMVAGLGAHTGTGRSVFPFLNSLNFLTYSARSLGPAFAFGMYAVLLPVKRKTAIVSCGVTVAALLWVEARWTSRAVKMILSDKLVLAKRFGCRARLKLAWAVLETLMTEFAPYILISLSGLI